MILERNVRDRYIVGGQFVTNGTTGNNQLLLTATFPQKLKVRNLTWCVTAAATISQRIVQTVALIIVRNGESTHTLFDFSGAPPVIDDLYVPADRVIYIVMLGTGDPDSGTGPACVNHQWLGDNKIIDLQVGDAIYGAAISSQANGATIWTSLDLDIVG